MRRHSPIMPSKRSISVEFVLKFISSVRVPRFYDKQLIQKFFCSMKMKINTNQVFGNLIETELLLYGASKHSGDMATGNSIYSLLSVSIVAIWRLCTNTTNDIRRHLCADLMQHRHPITASRRSTNSAPKPSEYFSISPYAAISRSSTIVLVRKSPAICAVSKWRTIDAVTSLSARRVSMSFSTYLFPFSSRHSLFSSAFRSRHASNRDRRRTPASGRKVRELTARC